MEDTILSKITGGEPVKVEINLDMKSISYLALGMIVAIFLGQVLASLISKRI